jgi:hypothetical protein
MDVPVNSSMGQVQNEVCLPDCIVLPLAEYADVDQLELKLKDSNISLQLVIHRIWF